jgi:type VI secretion system secreted protein VgrG
MDRTETVATQREALGNEQPSGRGYEASAPLRRVKLHVESGDAFDVSLFTIQERISTLFEIKIVAFSRDADVDFDAIVGRSARFEMRFGPADSDPVRAWTGICSQVQQVGVEERGVSTYELTVVPKLWLATQRRNYRMFQHVSELEIAKTLLSEWGIEAKADISGVHKKRKYRVQYGESDFAFVSRMLEDAGISYFFEEAGAGTRLVLCDAPQAAERREASVAYRERPTAHGGEHVTKVHVGQRVRPGRYTVRDYDTRLPASYPLLATAATADGGVEAKLERFHYVTGAFQFGTDQAEGSPHADDRGKARSDEKEGAALARKRLDAKRASAKVCTFETNAVDLAPGVVMAIVDHPRSDLGEEEALLIVESVIEGASAGEWVHRCEARKARAPFRPPLSTPKPRASGVESATVVGPAGDEIHTDEFGRVRVHFHWDRESGMDHRSSCWIHVSQAWGGAGYGGSNLPRIGQEVLVDFLGGDPDRPVITGRLYTNLQKTPYKLPENKTQSGWRSNSTNQTGGYNEIMFEDASGKELLRMQAEKDLHKLVKNDEEVVVGHDRTKLVKNDDKFTVGRDRTKLVERDEDVTIGHDRSKLVKNDDDLTVGNNRTKLVQKNERSVVGKSRTRAVGVNESVSIGVNQNLAIGAAQSVEIGANQSVTVGGAQAITVAAAAAETVGAAKALTVGGAYQVTVGPMMNTTVMGMQSEQVGFVKTVNVGERIELVCGRARVVLEREGKITWEIDEGARIVLDDKDITMSAAAGGTVVIVGGPNVQINPPPPK